MKEIYLVRHGETEWNRLRLAQGSNNDIPLNNNGMWQSKITGRYLKDYRIKNKQFDLILTSPMKRARQTAENICDVIEFDKKKINVLELINEQNQGLLSVGKTIDELRKDNFYGDAVEMYDKESRFKDPIAKHEYMDIMDENICEKYKCETMSSLKKRAAEFIEFLKSTKYEKIIVVTHAGYIHAVNSQILNALYLPTNSKHGSNCAITCYSYDGNFRLLSYPSTEHLGIYKARA